LEDCSKFFGELASVCLWRGVALLPEEEEREKRRRREEKKAYAGDSRKE